MRHISRDERLRMRAQETRALAETLTEPKSQKAMLAVAEAFERMALSAEQRQKKRAEAVERMALSAEQRQTKRVALGQD